MIFIYKKWEKFCKELAAKNIHSVTSRDVLEQKAKEKYIILKHDVETNVARAFAMARIEQRYAHCGTYYVQAYLMKDVQNICMLREMAEMGHEISYHYDVMDSCKGNLDNAIKEFEDNVTIFKKNGFDVKTVCQHGNPIVERSGYTSNRDFFRSEKVQALFPKMTDIMVDFKIKANTEFLYFSDAGRIFKQIYDPIDNDIINSDDKNIPFKSLEELLKYIERSRFSCIVSTHPHRWTRWALIYVLKAAFFKVAKSAAKTLLHVPFMRKIMGRYYYLAKKI